jgi:hypothetical protein
MKLADPELESLYREGVPARGACPPDDDITRAAEGSLARRERERLADHIAVCAPCVRAYRVAHSLRSWALDAADPDIGDARAASPARPASGKLRWSYTFAAVALGAAAGLVLLLLPRAPSRQAPAEIRGGAPNLVRSLLADGVTLSRERFVLRWAALPGARYRVTVATSDLAPLHGAAGLTSAEHHVPAEALASVPSQTTLVWTVEAFFPDGRRLESIAAQVRLE